MLFRNEHAITEVVGTSLLVLVAVATFTLIFMSNFPPTFPPVKANIDLMGCVRGENAIIEHIGGHSLSSYEIYIDGELYEDARHTDTNGNGLWDIGECYIPSVILENEDEMVNIAIYQLHKDKTEEMVFYGVLNGKRWIPPILISSLLTDTSDEDLICFTKPIDPDVDPVTYIFNWIVNGNPVARQYLPFDTENATVTKDYSGNGYNGTIEDAVWSNQGRLGGAYYFDGSSTYIETNLPDVFDDIANNDFTISMWVTSGDTNRNWMMALEARKNNSNFLQVFQYDAAIHFGVCDDRAKRAVMTPPILNDTWYNIVCVWDASQKTLEIYCNGNLSTEVGNEQYSYGSHEGICIGQRTDSSRNWLGFIDEFYVYDRVLSAEQIYEYYQCTKDGKSDRRVFTSEETSLGDLWQCILTPNDGIQDGTVVKSNKLRIRNYSGGD